MGGRHVLAEQLAASIDAIDKALQGPALTHLLGKAPYDGRAGAGIEVLLDPSVDQDFHVPLRFADENQHPRGTAGALQVLLAKLLAGQARRPPAAPGTRDQPAGQARVAQQQAQADEQYDVGHQQATDTGPAQQHLQQARHGQRQHCGPEQWQVGVIVGTAGQHRYQFGIGAPFGTGNGFGDLTLIVFVEGGHASGLSIVLIVVVQAFRVPSAADIFRHNPPLEESPPNCTTIAA